MSQPQDSQIMQFRDVVRNGPLDTSTPGGVYLFEAGQLSNIRRELSKETRIHSQHLQILQIFLSNLETWTTLSPTCLTRLMIFLCCQWSLEVLLVDGNPLMTSV
ncbi:hypothetical protein EUGRSUZ_E03141 [Eucalyptus grandis]|uniref:Uncharacterized protein n=2 Tax=Eucalyptus grandis TaxID=71139 RepID=A0ACC3KZ29_EUCGR|nr:hypothetical protein EUGRSUZ_E03141 [Eucalyptus grandis]